MKILIEGDPIPAARPRFSGHCYQPQRNMEYREKIKTAAHAAMSGKKPMTGAISAAVKIYRRFKLTSRAFGDIDNFLKALFDGMNQIVFEDDAQICRCLVEKFTDRNNPRAEIELGAVRNVKSETRKVLP